MKRTKVERLAEGLYNLALPVFRRQQRADIVPWSRVDRRLRPVWLALARHVLTRERRARGRTVGWTTVETASRLPWSDRRDCESYIKRNPGTHLARVVLVPRRGRR